MNTQRTESLKKARKAAMEEKRFKPMIVFFVLLAACLAFFELLSFPIAILVMLPVAIAGITWPESRGAPSYGELVDMIDQQEHHEDPIIEALTRK
jgi:hypothetical protein